MKIFKILPIAIALLAGFTSCDGIFRETPYDKLAENEIWSNEQLLDEYTGSWYRNMDNGFYILVSTTFKNLGQEFEPWFGDQLTVGRRDWYQAGYGELLKGAHAQITSRSKLVWQGYYEQLRSVNKLLEHESELPASIRDRILGEAHYFRAWYHFLLLRRYGGAIIMERTYDPLVESMKLPRASFEQMVTFIASEADKAAKLLPAEHESRHVGRITKGAAYTLMGKTYYWAAGDKFCNSDNEYLGFKTDRRSEMRGKAAAAYDLMMGLHLYGLIDARGLTRDETVSKYREIFLTKNSTESILEVQHSDNGDFLNGFGHKLDRDATPPSLTGTNCAYNPTQNHVDEYRMANGKMIDEPGSGYDEDFPYENRDVRFYANILYDGAMWKGHKMDLHTTVLDDGTQVPGADLVAYGTSTTASFTRTGYYMAKFLRESQQIDTDETYASSQNYIIWRYAEILLDYAEIDFLEGRTGDALIKINDIRRRVGMPELASVKMADIENERRVELAFEKTTYWDLIRNGTAHLVMTGDENPLYKINIKLEDGEYTYRRAVVNGRDSSIRFFDTYHYFWPMAWNDIRYHGIEQNPGWREM